MFYSQHNHVHQPWIKAFLLLSWCHMLLMTRPYFILGFEGDWLSANVLFHLAAWPLYSLLYLLPAFITAWLLQSLCPHRQWIGKSIALLLSVLCMLFIWSDSLVFGLYSFHVNRFVLNLVMTEGGIDSLNSSAGTWFSVGMEVARVFAIQCLLLFIAGYRHSFLVRHLEFRTTRITLFFFSLFCVQGVSYGIGDVTNDAGVLEHAYNYPFFQKIRFRSIAAKLGYETNHRDRFIQPPDSSRLQYPLNDVKFKDVVDTPNIVWLVAESMRWDQLTPETMPNTWALARDSWHYRNHYSSGNGTREGMFGMFYGLYGSYWDSFLHARQSPLLMNRLQDLGYAFNLRTGARFTYPEFKDTILANMPPSTYFEADESLSPWQRDAENTAELIRFIQEGSDRPFMAFQFFESTHAPYFFPEEHAIRKPYPESLNYAEFSKVYLDENIAGILNRYRNAGNWVDHQIGMIIDALKEQGLQDDTIIIVTGDHGEEFMEKGNWGHNSTFVEEQTHVPFILHKPGSQPKSISALTSHLDVATTLLDLLGAYGNSANYSLGMSLLDMKPRDSITISDWHSIAVVTNDMKIRIPYINTGFNNWMPTDNNDKALNSQRTGELLGRYQEAITQVMEKSSLFTRGPLNTGTD